MRSERHRRQKSGEKKRRRNELRLASEREKRWLAKLAEQNQWNQLVEEKVEGSLKSGGTQKDEDGVCWGCQVWKEPCQ